MENRFPREDKYPSQYSGSWTTCTRCKKQTPSYGDDVHYIDGFPYCADCYEKVKVSYQKTP